MAAGTAAVALLTASPLARPAAAADGDVIAGFGTNGRTTFATGPTPAIRAVVAHTRLGQRDVVVEHSSPPRITVTESGIVASDACAGNGCRLLPDVGAFEPFYEANGTIVNLTGSGRIGNPYEPPTGTVFRDPLPTGRVPLVTVGPSFFVTVDPFDPAVPPYLAFSTAADRTPVRIGDVGVPEPLADGGFAVVSADGGLVEVRYYDASGAVDVSRGFAGRAQNLRPETVTTIRAVIALADGGLAVLVTFTASGGSVVGTTLLRFDADGLQHDGTVDGPSLTWSPQLVELPGRAVALVGTTTAPSATNTIVRVDAAAVQPFTVQTVGGPQVIDAAAADALGRIVVVGGTSARPRSTMTVARVTTAGALDPGFGTSGVVNRSLPDATSLGFGVAIGEDSGIYAVASQDTGVLVDALLGSAPVAHRTRVALDALAPSPTTGSFTPMTPTRVLDTRDLGLPLQAEQPRSIRLDTTVPSSAIAVALNITAVDPVAAGFVRVWSADDGMPETSMLNHAAGETVANATLSRLGASRALRVFSHVTTDLVIDVVGYWTPSLTSRAGRLVTIAPTRLLDTRDGGGARRPDGSVTTLAVRSRSDLGLEHARAVVLAVTVADPVGAGFVTVWPGGDRPLASTLNVGGAGELRTNLAIVGVRADGTVSLFNQRATHEVVDVVGFVTDDTAERSVHGLLRPVAPVRVVDSRVASSGRLAVGQPSTTVVDCCGAGEAALYNLTAVDPSAAGFLTAYPSDRALPLASSVNFDAGGQRRASLAVTSLGLDGEIALYANVPTDYVVDLLGVLS